VIKRIIAKVKSVFVRSSPKVTPPKGDPELEARNQGPEGYQLPAPFGPWNIPDGLEMYGMPRVIPGHIEDAIIAERENGMGDSGPVSKAWAKLQEATDPFRAQFGTPYTTGSPVFEVGSINPLLEWNWQTRRYILEQCHLAWERNPLAAAIVGYYQTFSVQNGFTLSTQNNEVRKVLEDFINNPYNNIRELDKSLVASLWLDGEIFIRFFEGGGDAGGKKGETVIVPLRPWGVQWIHADPDNWRNVINYRYSTSISDGSGYGWKVYFEDIDADEILHIAINRLPYEQRGRPELFKILPYLSAYKRWLEDRARQNAFRGGVLNVTLHNATALQVAAKISAYKKPAMAGTTFVHNDNEEVEVLQQNVGASDASEDGRRILLMIAAGAGLPEYMMSDGANANLASATAQQMPAMRKFADVQDIMNEQLWTPVFKRVLQTAIDGGVLPEMVEVTKEDGTPVNGLDGTPKEPIPALEAFSLSYSDLESLDIAKTIPAILSAMNANLISEQDATGLLPWDLDYADQQEKIDAEQSRKMAAMMAGNRPMPPGTDPATGKPGEPPPPVDPNSQIKQEQAQAGPNGEPQNGQSGQGDAGMNTVKGGTDHVNNVGPFVVSKGSKVEKY
jgi:hypothetical protein